MHQQTDDVIVTTRQFSLKKENFDAYVTIARFCYVGSDWKSSCNIKVELPGQLVDVVFAAYIEDKEITPPKNYNEAL